ncbi:hypothetical protein ACYZUA_09985 [Pseudomonas sp. LS2P72]
MREINYPRRKVFMAFFFCPLVLGFFADIFKFVALLAHLASTPRFGRGKERGTTVAAGGGSTHRAGGIFFLPFLGFALVVTWLKINRTPRNCVVLSLAGSCLAMLWALLFVAAVVHGVKSAKFSDYIFEMLMISVASTATCWLAARFFLPEARYVKC